MSVYKKLMEARTRLQSREIKKSGRNTFANYSYMELGDFLVPTQTIFAEVGLCGVVSFTADTATLTITDTDDGSQIVLTSPMGSAALKGCHEVQNIGAVETYQRRYLWMAAMEIVEHDALDSGPPADDLVPVLKASIAAVEKQKTGALQAAAEDAGKHLDAPTKTGLAKLAFEVKNVYETSSASERAGLAFDRIEIEELNGDEKTYLWAMLPSNIRSALKTERQHRAMASVPTN